MNNSIVFGVHAVHAILKSSPERVLEVLVQTGKKDSRIEELLHLAKKLKTQVNYISRNALDHKCGEAHQGIMAVAIKQKTKSENDLSLLLDSLSRDPLLLILDGVTDPRNLGACLRTCDAACVDAVIIPKNNAASLDGVVTKVACGAAETVPLIQVTNLVRTMDQLKDRGIWLFGTDENSETSIYQMSFQGPMGLVVGSENTGMRRLTRENCDYLAKIPMGGLTPSLNVSVAVGVCLYEVVRQKSLIGEFSQ